MITLEASVKPYVTTIMYNVLRNQTDISDPSVGVFLEFMKKSDKELLNLPYIGKVTLEKGRGSVNFLNIALSSSNTTPQVPSTTPSDGRPFSADEFLTKLGQRFPSRGIPDAYGYMDTVIAWNEKNWDEVKRILESVF